MNRRNFLQLLPSALVALLPVSQDGEPDLDVPQAHSDIDYEELAQAILDTPLIGPETISEVGLWVPPQEKVRAFHMHPTDSGGPASDTHNHNITINHLNHSELFIPFNSGDIVGP